MMQSTKNCLNKSTNFNTIMSQNKHFINLFYKNHLFLIFKTKKKRKVGMKGPCIQFMVIEEESDEGADPA